MEWIAPIPISMSPAKLIHFGIVNGIINLKKGITKTTIPMIRTGLTLEY
jgi:hypothetical protein